MTRAPQSRRHYWQRYTDGDGHWRPQIGAPPGEDLAALRRGIGQEAGAVPQMWRFYTTLVADGSRTQELFAEHIALTLYAVHQQSRPEPVHRSRIGVGEAVRSLVGSGKFSQDAVERRFAAAATATSLAEVSVHLRGLITQLRGNTPGLDYTLLFKDLLGWQNPERAQRVRRRWGSQYFVHRQETDASDQARDGTTPSGTHQPNKPIQESP